MQIVNEMAIQQFAKRQPLSRKPLSRWVAITQQANWNNIIDVQRSFPAAEEVKGKVIFNIHGNHFRLIAAIAYSLKKIVIHNIFTHAEYNKWRA